MENIFQLKRMSIKNGQLIQHNAIKRIFDIFFSLFALIILSPIYLIIGLLVFFTSPGPIFYSCTRLGRGKKVIKCWKFRTMVKNADKKLQNLLDSDPELKKQWQLYYKLKNDPRITKIGKFLRRTSLDELPQFFNVLMGDLSIVGPRPKVPKELADHYHDKEYKILKIRPGVTGPFQITYRSDLTLKERFAMEEEYIETRSIFKDILIIFKTIKVMIFAKGAY